MYFQTWSSRWASAGSELDLGKLEKPVTIVNLAFVQPTCTYYTGQRTWAGTGLNFSSDFGVVAEAIKILRGKGIKVMLSVGGGSYWSTTQIFQPANCVALMNDLGCDGIDLDWEVGAAQDNELTYAIVCLKPLIGAGKISIAGWSTGAYPKDGGTFSGMNISALVNQGVHLDWVNIMAYDAGTGYKSQNAWNAYKSYYGGPLLLGMEVGTQGWGGALLQSDEVRSDCGYVLAGGKQNGIMVWALQKESVGTVSVPEIITITQQVWGAGDSGGGRCCFCPHCGYSLTIS